MTSLEDKHRELNRSEELAAAIPDNFDENTVIRYFKGFEDGGPVFTYTALKVNQGKWFTDGKYYTWPTLLYKIDEDNIYEIDGVIEVAVEWADITEFQD